MSAGKAYALVDTNHDAHADLVTDHRENGLAQPNGVAFSGEQSLCHGELLSYRDSTASTTVYHPPEPVLIFGSFPPGGEHG